MACNPGASPGAITALERAFGKPFEPAFTAYLGHTNGFKDFEWDDAMFSFWSAERILQELDDGHPAELFCFADHCINLGSFGYGREVKAPTIYLHYQHADGFEAVADSFPDFLRRYLQDPFALLR